MTHTHSLRQDALAIWEAGVAAAQPERLVSRTLSVVDGHLLFGDHLFEIAEWQDVAIVGAGKASAGMARTLIDLLEPHLARPLTGCVAVPDAFAGADGEVQFVAARPTGVNRPTAEGAAAAERILAIAAGLGPKDVLFAVFSGGGSALLPAPAEGITLADLKATTGLLAEAGIPIGEANCVRKHISRSKGGRLAKACGAGLVVGLYLSDVIGDAMDVVASGPTAPDPTTFADALEVLTRRGLVDDPRLPAAVREHLVAGASGALEDTPDELPAHVHNGFIGSVSDAVRGAAREAGSLGYRVLDLGASLVGAPADVARLLAGTAAHCRDKKEPTAPPLCLLSAGEAPVELVPGHGIGGRNQHLAIEVLHALARGSIQDIACVCGGTDGEDGPTDAAGGAVDAVVLANAEAAGLDLADHVARQDSHTYLAGAGGLVKTGLTGTNVADLRVVVVGAPDLA